MLSHAQNYYDASQRTRDRRTQPTTPCAKHFELVCVAYVVVVCAVCLVLWLLYIVHDDATT